MRRSLHWAINRINSSPRR